VLLLLLVLSTDVLAGVVHCVGVEESVFSVGNGSVAQVRQPRLSGKHRRGDGLPLGPQSRFEGLLLRGKCRKRRTDVGTVKRIVAADVAEEGLLESADILTPRQYAVGCEQQAADAVECLESGQQIILMMLLLLAQLLDVVDLSLEANLPPGQVSFFGLQVGHGFVRHQDH
jgi:hypothetical protein